VASSSELDGRQASLLKHRIVRRPIISLYERSAHEPRKQYSIFNEGCDGAMALPRVSLRID
jgi:hypothetical protein